jgi:c(7)-type cytochrome triheme protein
MRRRHLWRVGLLVLGAGLLTASLANGQSLPALPVDVTLPQGPDSPGRVVFSHGSHVDFSRPDCTSCHPRVFKMLKREVTAGTDSVVHAKMEKGQQCGVCHNGKDAHGFEDCTSCHRQQ